VWFKYDAIYVRELEINPGPRSCSKFFKIPLYLEINDLIPVVLNEKKVSLKKRFKATKNQKLDFKQSTGLIVNSIPMINWLIDKYSLPSEKVHLILNGADEFRFKKFSQIKARKEIGIPDNCFCLVFVGNIYKEYDFTTILEAVAECKNKIADIRLILIGNGPLINHVKKRVDDLKIKENVIFTGYIPQKNLSKILAATDVGLLIRTKEGYEKYGPISTKLSTYALNEKTVIAAGATIDGYPDDLGKGLYLVHPGDPYALSDLIIELYNNLEGMKKKAKILYHFGVKNLTWEFATREILKIINHDKKLKLGGDLLINESEFPK
jgi:glycosyltransferase involved in cell wall biosynthesis